MLYLRDLFSVYPCVLKKYFWVCGLAQRQHRKIAVVLEEVKQLNVGENGGGSRKNL